MAHRLQAEPLTTPQAKQNGVITLMVVTSLVMLASLAGFYSARSVLTDRLASNHQSQATQARLAAEAALAWARADLAHQYATQPDNAFVQAATARSTCPVGHTGSQWQCSLMSPPVHPLMPETISQVLAVRDLVQSPHVVGLWASARLGDTLSQGSVQASVFVPSVAPAPSGASSAALVLNGCSSAAASASLSVCPLSSDGAACNGTVTGDVVHSLRLTDTDGNGLISDAERNQCLGFLPQHLPAGGVLSGTLLGRPSAPSVAASATPAAPCAALAWQHVLGNITPAQIQAWSQAQERQGLHAQSQPQRSIYWVDQTTPWTQSLGTADAPVLLVFSDTACALRCPSIASGVHIWGTVVLQTQCQDHKAQAWRAGRIDGQLVVESGLHDLQTDSHIQARSHPRAAYRLNWPPGIDATRVQGIPGSWREGTP